MHELGARRVAFGIGSTVEVLEQLEHSRRDDVSRFAILLRLVDLVVTEAERLHGERGQLHHIGRNRPSSSPFNLSCVLCQGCLRGSAGAI
jgi:hypothetical protein